MPISEKPVKIEFTYTPNKEEAENMDPIIVEFFQEDKISYVRTKTFDTQEEVAVLSVGFMVEVVDYLRTKGAIGGGTNIRTPAYSTVRGQGAIQQPVIPVTQIEAKEEGDEEEEVEKDFNSGQIPFSSFDVSQTSSPNAPVESSDGTTIIVGGDVKEEDIESMQKRKVIKSNSVEESAMLRGEVPDKDKFRRT